MTPTTRDDPAPPTQGRPDNLALLLQGVFTAIVRIQSGKQLLTDFEVFRRRMTSAILEVERDAIAARYAAEDIDHAKFAVVALLDETILTSKDPGREEWRKKTLSAEMFGEANAGEVFFDRLQTLVRREDSLRLGDVLEVYLLCLLLGFEGRHAGPLRGEALVLADRVRRRIEGIRGLDYRLSPPVELASTPQQPTARAAPPPSPVPEWLRWAAAGAGGVILLFLLFKIHLIWRLGQVQEIAGK